MAKPNANEGNSVSTGKVAERHGQRRSETLALTVPGGDGGEEAISAAAVDRMRHTVTHNQYGSPCYELRMWSEGRPVTLGGGPRDAVRPLAADVAARHGVERLEIGTDWGSSIFYLIIAIGGMLTIGWLLFLMVTEGGGTLFLLPVMVLLGYALYRTMRGRWPPRRAGSLENFLAVLAHR